MSKTTVTLKFIDRNVFSPSKCTVEQSLKLELQLKVFSNYSEKLSDFVELPILMGRETRQSINLSVPTSNSCSAFWDLTY